MTITVGLGPIGPAANIVRPAIPQAEPRPEASEDQRRRQPDAPNQTSDQTSDRSSDRPGAFVPSATRDGTGTGGDIGARAAEAARGESGADRLTALAAPGAPTAPTVPGAPGAPASLTAPPAAPGEARDVGDPFALSDEEQRIVRELQRTDAEVRRHEQAHKAVAGPFAGAISFTFQTGPDGRRYAVAGSVPIDTAPVAGDPEATIRKLETVRRAALAPSRPSAADRGIAAAAAAGIQQAQAELAAQRTAEAAEATGPEEEPGVPAPFPAQQPALPAASFATVSDIYQRNGSADARRQQPPLLI